MGKHFSVCEILEMGIQIEKNGYDFYTVLSKTIKNERIASMFKCLAEEEAGHIDLFRGLIEKVCDYQPEGAYPEEYFSFMRAFSSQYVFTKSGLGKEMAAGVKDLEDGINMGIEAEKDSIIFYGEMKKYVNEKDKVLVEDLIQEEKRHLIRLCDLKGGNQGEECKGI